MSKAASGWNVEKIIGLSLAYSNTTCTPQVPKKLTGDPSHHF